MDVLRRIGDTLKSKRIRRPVVSVILSTVVSYSLTLVVITTDYWETTDFHDLETLPNLLRNDSIIDDHNGFYSLKLISFKQTFTFSNYQVSWSMFAKQNAVSADDSYNMTQNVSTPFPPKVRILHVVLRSKSGGIWQICDRISGMQNSAVSCVIVCILCMASSLCTGAFSIWKEQVAVCMVTGVLNCVSGTFLCFALTIMATKFRYMAGDCLTIDTILPAEVCRLAGIHMSWSMALGWFSLVVVVLNAMVWLYLSRCYRLEKSKSIV